MAKKNKNRIFEEQNNAAAETTAAAPKEIKTDLAPDVSNESMVENVLDDPSQMDLLNDRLSQISQLTTELNAAKQKIAELEAEIKKLQANNDALVIKLADSSSKNIELRQIGSSNTPTIIGKSTNNVVSKRVNYIHADYSNNGYGTWH